MAVEKVAFVCAGNAGRSQLAAALAERERDARGLDLAVVSGGIDPSERVYGTVVEVLAEEGIDVSDRTPRRIRAEDIADADYVVTMGCSIDDVRPEGWSGTVERWDLEHPSADDVEETRAQRDEIRERVRRLLDAFAAG